MAGADRHLGAWRSIATVARSWRLTSVTLLSFASGLPLGLVWIAVPAWMTQAGIDIKVVGLFTLAQAPWAFKFLWSPLMDRYTLPILGRKRGWIFVTQLVLLGLGLWLAAASRAPSPWTIGLIVLAIAFAAASQDIVVDAYAVEVLLPDEQGLAVGARVALYRAAMFMAGALAITLAAPEWIGSWAAVNLVLALCFLPMLLVTWLAPEPDSPPVPPRSLRAAVWEPFLGFLAQRRSLEILAFVVLFKLADNLTQALTRPFLIKMGFSGTDVGVGTGTVGLLATLAGTFLGGLLTNRVGLGRALWLTGILQSVASLGYALVAQVGQNLGIMYGAIGLEMATSGMGTGAFGVLLLRLTQKRFSATQFALLSSLFSLPRILAGPVAGLLADWLGWRDFFVLTVFAGVPGMLILWRFAPWHVREPEFHVAAPPTGEPITRRALAGLAAAAGLAGLLGGLLTGAFVEGAQAYRKHQAFELGGRLLGLLSARGSTGWVTLAGSVLFGASVALTVAALTVARRGVVSGDRRSQRQAGQG